MNYSIRLAKKNELWLLKDIEEAAATLFTTTKYGLELQLDTLSNEILEKQQKENCVWLALDEKNKAVAFAVVLIINNFAHLHEISVDPKYGRKGIGTKIIQTIMFWAKATKLKGLTLSTFRDIPWNAPFYKKLGFREMKDEEISQELQNIRNDEKINGLPLNERLMMVLPF